MGENSGIQWTTHTFNPWVGCQRVSPGCEHCYAETYDKRVGGVPKKQRADPDVPETRWGPKGKRTRTSPSNWRQPLKWDAAAKAAGERYRVFCSSLADVFEDRPDLAPWRLELLHLVFRTPQLDWLLLTKRPQNVLEMLRAAAADSTVSETTWQLKRWLDGTPPANVWLGTTVEDQRRANERIPELLKVPGTVRFLSCEPLLAHVDLSRWLPLPDVDGHCTTCGLEHADHQCPPGFGHIDWVIIGGESGGGARPFALEWARDLVKQCRAAGVAPFVKQLGACASDEVNGIAGRSLQVPSEAQGLISRRLADPAGGDMAEWPG